VESQGKARKSKDAQEMEMEKSRLALLGGCRMRHGGATPMRLQFMFADKMGFAFCFCWLLLYFDLDIGVGVTGTATPTATHGRSVLNTFPICCCFDLHYVREVHIFWNL